MTGKLDAESATSSPAFHGTSLVDELLAQATHGSASIFASIHIARRGPTLSSLSGGVVLYKSTAAAAAAVAAEHNITPTNQAVPFLARLSL